MSRDLYIDVLRSPIITSPSIFTYSRFLRRGVSPLWFIERSSAVGGRYPRGTPTYIILNVPIVYNIILIVREIVVIVREILIL